MAVAAIALAAGAWPAAARATDLFLDGYAAVVNDRVITVGDVLRMIQSADRRATLSLDGERLKETLARNYQEGLKTLIDREMILAEAIRRELDLQDPMVDGQISQIVRERFDNNRTAFLAALEEDGLSLSAYRDQIRNDLRVMLLRRQEVTDRVMIGPADVRAAYAAAIDAYRQPEQVHLQLLVLRRGETDAATETKRKQATEVRGRVAGGEKFGDIVRALSEGPKADEGGDLGWVNPADLNVNLAAAVKNLKQGQASPVIEVGDEFHVVFLVERKAASVRALSDVQGDVERELEKKAMEQRFDEWMSELRVRNYVRILQASRP